MTTHEHECCRCERMLPEAEDQTDDPLCDEVVLDTAMRYMRIPDWICGECIAAAEEEDTDESPTDLDRLCEAVRAAPGDSTLRLVYADALEEAGENRLARIQRYAAGLGIYTDIGGCTASDIVDAYIDHHLEVAPGDASVSVSVRGVFEDTIAGQRSFLSDRELVQTGDGAIQESRRVEIHLVVAMDEKTLIPTYEIRVHENGGYPLEDEGPCVICSSRGDLTIDRLIEESQRR